MLFQRGILKKVLLIQLNCEAGNGTHDMPRLAIIRLRIALQKNLPVIMYMAGFCFGNRDLSCL